MNTGGGKNMNISVSIKEFEIITKYIPTKHTPDSESFTGEFYQTLKQEIILIVFKYFQKIWVGNNF